MTAIREGTVVKGNVLSTARVAATLSVKNTPSLIPMCHSIPISAIAVDFVEGDGFIEATVRVKSTGKTGVEMEALVGVSVALLTVWDMVKSAEKDAARAVSRSPVFRISGSLRSARGTCNYHNPLELHEPELFNSPPVKVCGNTGSVPLKGMSLPREPNLR